MPSQSEDIYDIGKVRYKNTSALSLGRKNIHHTQHPHFEELAADMKPMSCLSFSLFLFRFRFSFSLIAPYKLILQTYQDLVR